MNIDSRVHLNTNSRVSLNTDSRGRFTQAINNESFEESERNFAVRYLKNNFYLKNSNQGTPIQINLQNNNIRQTQWQPLYRQDTGTPIHQKNPPTRIISINRNSMKKDYY